MWNARKKDVLEERLHEMVCSHRLDLSVAQEAIASNWIAAYERYVSNSAAASRCQTIFAEKIVSSLVRFGQLLSVAIHEMARNRLVSGSYQGTT